MLIIVAAMVSVCEAGNTYPCSNYPHGSCDDGSGGSGGGGRWWHQQQQEQQADDSNNEIKTEPVLR